MSLHVLLNQMGAILLPRAVFETAIPASEWPHNHALDRAFTGNNDWN